MGKVKFYSDAITRACAYTPIPVIVGVDTSDTSEPKFKYVLDVYVNKENATNAPGGTWTKVATLKQFADPDNVAIFDVHRIVQNYVQYRSVPGSLAVNLALHPDTKDGGYVWVKVECGCEYVEDTSPVTTVPTLFAAEQTRQFLAWNGAVPYEIALYYFSPADFFEMLSSDSGRFLGDFPSDGIPIRGDASHTLTSHSFGNNTITKICCQPDYSGGAFKSTIDYYGDADQTGIDMLIHGAGPYNINLWNLSTGTQPVIESDCVYYDVWLEDGSGDQISEKVRFVLDHDCPADNPVTLTWMNRWGGFDTYTFAGSNTRSVPVKRNSYEKIYGHRIGDATAGTSNYTWDLGERGRTNLGVDARDKWKLQSGFLTDSQATWIEQLFTSPVVNIVRYNDYTSQFEEFPVNVTSTSYEEKTMKRKRLISYSIEIEAAYDKHIQRG